MEIWLLIATLSTSPTEGVKHITRHFASYTECQVAATDMAALLRDMHAVTKIDCDRQVVGRAPAPQEKKSESF